MGRLVQPTLPKGCKRIRYDGVPASKTFTKVQRVIQTALAKGEGVVQGAVQLIARLPYRPRYAQSTGREPCMGPPCRGERGGACGIRPMG
jgi:hypothetical protein